MNKIETTIDYLNHCKNVFMDADFSFQRSLGVEEVEDLLSGISHAGKSCYVSWLFNRLTYDDRCQVQARLDFRVDFERLAAYYSL